MGKNFLSGFFSLFYTQNQAPQISIRMGRMIYHIKDLSIVIRARFLNFQKWFQYQEKQFEIFWFVVYARAVKASEQAYSS